MTNTEIVFTKNCTFQSGWGLVQKFAILVFTNISARYPVKLGSGFSKNLNAATIDSRLKDIGNDVMIDHELTVCCTS